MIKKISQLKKLPGNPRILKDEKYKQLLQSIKQFPKMLEKRKLVVDEDNYVLGGNQRLAVLKDLGYTEIDVEVFTNKDFEEAIEQHKEATGEDVDEKFIKDQFVIKDNVGFGEWDYDALSSNYNTETLIDWGLDLDFNEFIDNSEENGYEDGGQNGSMVDNFGLAPFSILDTTSGKWLEKRRKWINLGIDSEDGRDENLLGLSPVATLKGKSGTSIFDPVLTEISYKWFNIEGGTILDPFAGGSVRGIVASKLGYTYVGNDLREEQVLANRKQAENICDDNMPTWTIGDSTKIKQLVGEDLKADLLFTCPPYADLEVYSDKKEDLSNMDYKDFKDVYSTIIKESCDLLKDDRFAVIVVGEVRGKDGSYYNFVGDTINAFTDAGLKYYNELILVNSVGTLPLRAGRVFNNGRKIGKRHQNVLVFYKGDIKKIKDNYSNFTDLDKFIEEDAEKEEERFAKSI